MINASYGADGVFVVRSHGMHLNKSHLAVVAQTNVDLICCHVTVEQINYRSSAHRQQQAKCRSAPPTFLDVTPPLD